MTHHITRGQTGLVTSVTTAADVITSLTTAVEDAINVDECLVWAGQIGCHKLTGCHIVFWTNKIKEISSRSTSGERKPNLLPFVGLACNISVPS